MAVLKLIGPRNPIGWSSGAMTAQDDRR